MDPPIFGGGRHAIILGCTNKGDVAPKSDGRTKEIVRQAGARKEFGFLGPCCPIASENIGCALTHVRANFGAPSSYECGVAHESHRRSNLGACEIILRVWGCFEFLLRGPGVAIADKDISRSSSDVGWIARAADAADQCCAIRKCDCSTTLLIALGARRHQFFLVRPNDSGAYEDVRCSAPFGISIACSVFVWGSHDERIARYGQ